MAKLLLRYVKITSSFIILSMLIGACTSSTSTPVPIQTSDVTGEEGATQRSTAVQSEEEEPEPSSDDRPDIAVRLYTHDMQQLDPAFLGRSGDAWIANNIYNRLVRWKVGSPEIEPDLATNWEFSEDGMELSFFLREGVQWHKGYGEVTADDVKFSFDRILDPNTGSPSNQIMSIIDHVEVMDKYTVKLYLKQPSASLLTSILPFYPGFIISQEAFEDLGQEEFALNPIGSGPFMFDTWTPGNEVVLIANDDYYEGPPNLREVRLLPITDENAAVIALQTGEILFSIVGTPESKQVLDDDPDVNVVGGTGTLARYLWLNTRKSPMDNVLVRRALWHAIDHEAISEFGFNGIHPPLNTIFMPTFLCYKEDVPTYDFDPDRAKELLTEAGYPDGFGLTLLYSQRAVSQTIAELVQEMWRNIGVDLEITGLEHGTYTQIRRESRDDFDVILAHFGRTADPDSFLSETFHSGAFPPGANMSYYDKLDDLIETGRSELNAETRCEIYESIQEQLQNDAPAIPIVHTGLLVGIRKELTGYVPGASAAGYEFWAYPLDVSN